MKTFLAVVLAIAGFTGIAQAGNSCSVVGGYAGSFLTSDGRQALGTITFTPPTDCNGVGLAALDLTISGPEGSEEIGGVMLYQVVDSSLRVYSGGLDSEVLTGLVGKGEVADTIVFVAGPAAHLQLAGTATRQDD